MNLGVAVAKAAESGDRRALLVATRDRIAVAVDDAKTPPRDLASLTRRLVDIAKEIEAIDAAGKDGDPIGSATDTPDAAFDPEAI